MAIRQVTRAGVGLVVGIIILAALVFGGLWLVRERGEQARREEAIAIADQQLKDESNQETAINTDDANKESESTPEAQSGASSTQSSTNQASNAASGAAVTELPQTGPQENAIIVFGILAFAVASFVRSRKLLANSL